MKKKIDFGDFLAHGTLTVNSIITIEYRLNLSTQSVLLSEGLHKFWLAGTKSGNENLRSRSDLIFPEFLEFADFSQSPHTQRTNLISNPLPAEDLPTADSTIQNDRDKKNNKINK